MFTSLRTTVVAASVAVATVVGGAPRSAAATYTNLVPGNVASITTDIPSTWWGGGSPATLTDNSLTNRWLTGNYDVTWGAAMGSGGKLWPYNVTLTFTNPVNLSRIREIYLQDGGGFDSVDVTLYDAADNVLAQLFNVPKTSAMSWQARFPGLIENVKKVNLTVKAHGMPTYHDVRLGEIQVYDDLAAGNLARNATVTASSVGGGTLHNAHDEDFGSLFYSAAWTGSPEWVLFDFGRVETVAAFRLHYQASNSHLIKDYQIQVPDGLGGWTALISGTNPLGNYEDVFTLPTAIATSQVRLYVTDIYPSPDPRMRFRELEILMPEPASAAVLLLGAAALLFRSRRCHRRG
jgi:hypothetical protein